MAPKAPRVYPDRKLQRRILWDISNMSHEYALLCFREAYKLKAPVESLGGVASEEKGKHPMDSLGYTETGKSLGFRV